MYRLNAENTANTKLQPFFVLQKFLDNKSLTRLSQLCKPILANIFHMLSLRRQNHFRWKASQHDLVFGDPKFSHMPLFTFFNNFTDLHSVACVNKMTRELLLPLLLTHNSIFHKKYVFFRFGLFLTHPIPHPVGVQLQMLSKFWLSRAQALLKKDHSAKPR